MATDPATTSAPVTELFSTRCSLSPLSPSEVEDGSMNNETVDEDGKVEPPKPGMSFRSYDDLFAYYKQYGKQEGFGVTKRTMSISSSGKNVTVVCSRAGKPVSSSKNKLKPKPITKTECKARVNATIWDNGMCGINSVELQHNHGLSPSKSRFYLCNRELSMGTKRKLELNDQAGVRVMKNYNALVVEAGGYENVPFLEKDCRNYIEKARRLRLGVGDAEAIQRYFSKMQELNSNFFYIIDLDNDARIKNLFWADARSRASYREFGDVITFDTTYLTNKYDMPFAPFIGVNHHGQSILLGCGLLSNEDAETFTWLFQSWLSCMSGRSPNAIITDQDKAMQKAIQNVFPNTRHRWCLWHIMKKLPEKLRGYSMYEAIKYALQNVVYDSLTVHEFEESWRTFITKYNLEKNEWLCGLYDERHRWVPAFVKDTFWAGMSTTQRSEGMNAFFDGYVNSKTSLKQFVEQYDNALKSKVEKEIQADFRSFSSCFPCVTPYKIEKQFQEVYTNAKFKEFQEELTGKLFCELSIVREDGLVAEFAVKEDVHIGEKMKKIIFMVSFNAETCDVQCVCKLFNFRGILCKHAISVLISKEVEVVPSKYILPRWRKDLKRCHTRVKIGYDDWSGNPEAHRYDKLYKSAVEVAELAASSDDNCKWALSMLSDMKGKLRQNEVICESNQSTQELANAKASDDCPPDDVNIKARESTKVLSPLAVRSKGRPPSKRKQSKVEQIVRRKKNKHQVEENKIRKGKQKKGSCMTQEKRVGVEENVDMEQCAESVHLHQSHDACFLGTQESGNILSIQDASNDLWGGANQGNHLPVNIFWRKYEIFVKMQMIGFWSDLIFFKLMYLRLRFKLQIPMVWTCTGTLFVMMFYCLGLCFPLS